MKNKINLYVPAASMWGVIVFTWTYIFGNMPGEAIGAYEIVGAIFLTMICSSYLVGLGRKVVAENVLPSYRTKQLIDRGSVCFPWLTIMSCVTVAWGLSYFVSGFIPIKYSYLIGSVLFLPTFFMIFMRRKDLRTIMIIFGMIGIPVGLLTEYFFYGRDWWNAQRVFAVLDGRLGLADVVYSFFHGALLPASGLFFLQKKIDCKLSFNTLYNIFTRGIILAIVMVGGIFVSIWLTNLPSFYIVAVVFCSVGCTIIILRRDLWKLSVAGAVLTLCWAAPVYFVVNTVSPGWIESFWLADTDKVRILGIPLLDLLWYATAGFGAGPVLPFLLDAKLIPATSQK